MGERWKVTPFGLCVGGILPLWYLVVTPLSRFVVTLLRSEETARYVVFGVAAVPLVLALLLRNFEIAFPTGVAALAAGVLLAFVGTRYRGALQTRVAEWAGLYGDVPAEIVPFASGASVERYLLDSGFAISVPAVAERHLTGPLMEFTWTTADGAAVKLRPSCVADPRELPENAYDSVVGYQSRDIDLSCYRWHSSLGACLIEQRNADAEPGLRWEWLAETDTAGVLIQLEFLAPSADAKTKELVGHIIASVGDLKVSPAATCPQPAEWL